MAQVPTPKNYLSILIVDDCPEDRAVFRRLLSQGRALESHETDSGERGLELLGRKKPDCVLLDYNLPDVDGLEFLKELARRGVDGSVPVIMLTGHGNESIGAEAIQRGAKAYLLKDRLTAETLHQAVLIAVDGARQRTADDAAIERDAAAAAVEVDLLASVRAAVQSLSAFERSLEAEGASGEAVTPEQLRETVSAIGDLTGNLMVRLAANEVAASDQASC